VSKILVLVASALLLAPVPISAQQEVIVAIQVHGNTLTTEAEIVRTSGLSVGAVFSESLLSDAEARLRSSGRFENIEVLKRYASISDPAQILVVIRVDEGPVRIEQSPGQAPTVVRRRRFNVMFVPILDVEDGYGLTYGALFSITGYKNTTQRVIFPLSWGGDKRLSLEFQKEFAHRFAPRIRTGALVQRRTHPFFNADADRGRVWGRGEWPVTPRVRAAAEVAWQSSKLLGDEQNLISVGADLIFDTRLDPLQPHNAIYAKAAIEHLGFSTGSTVRTEFDATGYVGIYRGSVLAVRVLREDMSKSAPPFYKSILGGSSNLRGFRAGDSIGDTLMAGSAEIRIPLTSPLHIARFGASAFVDAGTVYNKGQRFRDQTLKRGIGAGIWAAAPLFHVSLVAAHGIGAGNRVHFGAGLTF
jgi:outer membrane protein assembly factor BamA